MVEMKENRDPASRIMILLVLMVVLIAILNALVASP